jgi:hypothetical protein
MRYPDLHGHDEEAGSLSDDPDGRLLCSAPGNGELLPDGLPDRPKASSGHAVL